MATKRRRAATRPSPAPVSFDRVAFRLGLSPSEAITALKSAKSQRPKAASTIPISSNKFSFGYFSDAHIGSNKFSDGLFDYMVRFFNREKPDFIANPGDHLEGMSGRPGHVYELSEVGFSAQIKKAVSLYRQLSAFDHFGIDGNHDEWYYRKNDGGMIVGEQLEKLVPNYHNLGQDEGDIKVGGIVIRLFHAGDGTAYAHSYKLQKLIESFSGGDKPNIVLSGHYHKALSLFSRGVHGFECGTLCGQTTWMRSKKIQAHMGFGLVTVTVNRHGIERLNHEFVPWFEGPVSKWQVTK